MLTLDPANEEPEARGGWCGRAWCVLAGPAGQRWTPGSGRSEACLSTLGRVV